MGYIAIEGSLDPRRFAIRVAPRHIEWLFRLIANAIRRARQPYLCDSLRYEFRLCRRLLFLAVHTGVCVCVCTISLARDSIVSYSSATTVIIAGDAPQSASMMISFENTQNNVHIVGGGVSKTSSSSSPSLSSALLSPHRAKRRRCASCRFDRAPRINFANSSRGDLNGTKLSVYFGWMVYSGCCWFVAGAVASLVRGHS